MRKPLIVGHKGQDLFALWRQALAVIGDDSTKDSCPRAGHQSHRDSTRHQSDPILPMQDIKLVTVTRIGCYLDCG